MPANFRNEKGLAAVKSSAVNNRFFEKDDVLLFKGFIATIEVRYTFESFLKNEYLTTVSALAAS